MRKVLINVEERELRVAILDDDQLVELYIESLDEKSILNNIYKGRIQDVLPGLKAAFVNIGLDRNAFLHFDDVRPDLIWGKYREMNPELADEVPTAREALAVDAEPEVEDDLEAEDKRKRRRGRRGGKKRRPDAEDSYSPGLPVGVTEDDLEDDEEEDSEITPLAARPTVEQVAAPERAPQKVEYVRPPATTPQPYTGMPAQPYTGMPAQPYTGMPQPYNAVAPASAPAQSSYPAAAAAPAPTSTAYPATARDGQPDPSGLSAEEVEQRKQARMDKQKQRRDRWEQKKLERQQRRQQDRTERIQQPGTNATAPEAQTQAQPEPPQPAAVYGTRGAPSAYDTYNQFNTGNQRRQHVHKDRFGDALGNVAIGNVQRNDHRDSQADFFGPMSHAQEEQHSIWDDRQPNLGPVPGAGKAFLAGFDTPSRGNDRRGTSRRPMGNNQNRPRRFGNNPNAGNTGNTGNTGNMDNTGNSNNKRRGGKKRTMRKRDTRSYFAFSADDLLDNEQLVKETPVTETEAPKKPARKRKIAVEADGEAPVKKVAARKPAAKKDPAAPKATTRKKKTDGAAAAEAPKVVAQELPLGIPESDVVTSEDATTAPKKPGRKPAGAGTRPRKTAAKAETAKKIKPTAADAPVADELAELTVAEPAGAAAAVTVSETPVQEQQDSQSQATEEPQQTQVDRDSRADTTYSQSEPQSTLPGDTVTPSAETAEQAPQAPVASDEQQRGVAVSGEDTRERSRRRNSRPTRAERAARQREKRAAAAQASNGEGEPEPGAVAADQTNGVATASADPTTYTEAPAASQQTYQAPSVRPAGQPSASEKSRHPNKRQDNSRKLRRPLFQDVFKKGDEIMVQVVKEEIGMKGARISSYVSLPGRYLVLLPYPNQEGGISRKVEDIRERKRLKNLLRDISTDETAFIIRTAGVFQEEKEIRDDVEFLNDEWGTIAKQYSTVEATGLVYDDHDILYRLARDVFDDSVAEIQIDSHTEHEKLKQILGKLIPGLVEKTKLYSGAENIFQKFGVTKQIQKAARRKVWLKSGGYLIIDEAEALTAIDVNTGKSVGKDDQEKLILRTNLESAKAVARELKLRDIGGLIVIDFIDMKDYRNKEQVLNELKLQLRKDRSKTSVSAISEFGLVEMTRKRVRRSLRKTLFMDCPYCQGAGVVLNEQQIWLHIKHEMVRQLESGKPAALLSITVNSRIRAYIDQNYRDVIRRLEQKYDTEIRVTMSDIFHMENYQIEKAETGVISGSATMPTM